MIAERQDYVSAKTSYIVLYTFGIDHGPVYHGISHSTTITQIDLQQDISMNLRKTPYFNEASNLDTGTHSLSLSHSYSLPAMVAVESGLLLTEIRLYSKYQNTTIFMEHGLKISSKNNSNFVSP